MMKKRQTEKVTHSPCYITRSKLRQANDKTEDLLEVFH